MGRIDEYIAGFDGEIRERMTALRTDPRLPSGYIREDRLGYAHLYAERKSCPLLRGKETHGLPSGKRSHRCLCRTFRQADPHQKHPASSLQSAHALGAAPGDGGLLCAGAFAGIDSCLRSAGCLRGCFMLCFSRKGSGNHEYLCDRSDCQKSSGKPEYDPGGAGGKNRCQQ